MSGVAFESAEELRQHYHTDWYRYNLQRSRRGLGPVTEADFDAQVESNTLDAELSGSGSDDSDDEGDASAAGRSDGGGAMSELGAPAPLVGAAESCDPRTPCRW